MCASLLMITFKIKLRFYLFSCFVQQLKIQNNSLFPSPSCPHQVVLTKSSFENFLICQHYSSSHFKPWYIFYSITTVLVLLLLLGFILFQFFSKHWIDNFPIESCSNINNRCTVKRYDCFRKTYFLQIILFYWSFLFSEKKISQIEILMVKKTRIIRLIIDSYQYC